MMILNFDNGTLSIQDFINIFWKDAAKGNKGSFIICNTFSRSPTQPKRFRVFMMYKKANTSLEIHQSVFDSIVQRLEINDHTDDSEKLDRGCRSGNQQFYMPTTNSGHPEWACFESHGCGKRDIERYGINPSEYLKTQLAPVEKIRLSGEAPSNVKAIEEWKEEIRSLSNGRHNPM
jgi:hypothetical protein